MSKLCVFSLGLYQNSSFSSNIVKIIANVLNRENMYENIRGKTQILGIVKSNNINENVYV